MDEKDIDAKVRELQGSSLELYSFVAEAMDHLEEDALDDLVRDLEGDYLSLREFVIHALEE